MLPDLKNVVFNFRNFDQNDLAQIRSGRNKLIIFICIALACFATMMLIPTLSERSDFSDSLRMFFGITYFLLLAICSKFAIKLGRIIGMNETNVHARVVAAFIFPVVGLAIISGVHAKAGEALKTGKPVT